jgi:hypothetical protein
MDADRFSGPNPKQGRGAKRDSGDIGPVVPPMPFHGHGVLTSVSSAPSWI